MTDRRRLRAALAALLSALVILGLWAIPVAAADTSTASTTSLSSSSTTSSSSSSTSTATSTTTPGSTATTTTTTTTTTTPTTSTTTPTTTTHTTSTPTTPTTTTTGPGAPHRQHSSSSRNPRSGHRAARQRRHRRHARPRAHRRKHSKHKHKQHKPKTITAKQPGNGQHAARTRRRQPPSSSAGSGTNAPGYSLSLPSAPPQGVPNFFIDSFQIPPFLLPIYQAAGIQYQVPWQVLAAINEIETDYGRNLSVSSAGAVGWMQFMPATWKQWGIDATGDGVADPYNPVDAIFSAARYLHAAGASTNLSRAIFAYNHADWYVQSVLLRAKLIGGIPPQLVSALTGLVEGHFPVAASARYSDNSVVALARHRVTGANAAITVDSNPATKGATIFAKPGSPVIAANDGKIIKLGYSSTLGHYVELQDATGNVYTYSQLGSISATYPVPKPVAVKGGVGTGQLATGSIRQPTAAASAGAQSTPPSTLFTAAIRGTEARLALTAESRTALTSELGTAASTSAVPSPKSAASAGAQRGAAGGSQTSSDLAMQTSGVSAPLAKERLFAHPSRPASYAAGGMQQLRAVSDPISNFKSYFADTLHLARNQYTLQPLEVGSIVIAGTILGRIGGPSQGASSHLYFQIQPAGHDAPAIDPKPILDGWKLLAATAVYRANGVDPFYGPGSKNPTVGQVLLMSKEQLERRVLTDPHVQIYACGRRDIEAGKIDRRVLAVIEYLSTSGLDPGVSGLACDASVNGTTGVDQAGSSGESLDISQINGVPIAGHTGAGSVTDQAIRRLLALQGSLAPTQIIGPISYRDQSTTLALPSHDNRLQILFGSSYGANGKVSKQVQSILKPGQWTTLINRLSEIPEPIVAITPSRYAIREPAR